MPSDHLSDKNVQGTSTQPERARQQFGQANEFRWRISRVVRIVELILTRKKLQVLAQFTKL
ncbi:MAG: hypothetical protein WKF77_16220, partial [Planctomycetaceae bacterium]